MAQPLTTSERAQVMNESTRGVGVTATRRPGAVAVTVCPTGRLERDHCEASYRAITLLSVVPGADITVDLRAVPSLDETSAQLIADAQRRTRRHGGRFTVLWARSQPHEALLAVGAGLDGPAPVAAPAVYPKLRRV